MKNRIKLLFLTASFSLLITVYLYAADDIKIQRVLDTGTFNSCITQDKDGLLWISTWGGGLLCGDGNELKRIKITKNEEACPIMLSMFVDKEGIIWAFAAHHELYSYDKSAGICKQHKPTPNNSNFLTYDNVNWIPNNIIEDKDGLIWFGTIDGLNSFDKKTGMFTQHKHDPNNINSLSNNSVWFVFVCKDGLIWAGTQNGLNSYDKKTGKFRCYKNQPGNFNSLTGNQIRVIVEDKEGHLWIGTKNTGIAKFDKRTNTFINYRHNPNDSNSISSDAIFHLMVDQLNNLWICNGSNSGLDRYDININTFKHYDYDPKDLNSISSSDILYSFEDNAGIIWLLHGSGCIDKCTWKQDVFSNYSHNPKDSSSISSNSIITLYEDKNDNIWAGTFRGGLSLYTKNGKFENFKPIPNDPFSLPSNSVTSILDASDCKLWLGIDVDDFSFVYLFDITSKKIIKSFKNPYSDWSPCLLTQDNKNPDIIWFASFFAGGLFNLNTTTGKFTQYKHIPGDISSISDKPTFSILQEGDILWLGTGGDGLTKFDKTTGKCIHYKHDPNDKNSISGNLVIKSYIDSSGNFWVVIGNGGLNKFNRKTEKFTSYGVKDGFLDNRTRHILEDKEGYFWISTASGIVKFDQQTSKVIRLFTETDGLSNYLFTTMTDALKDSKGNFWFPNTKGICNFNPEDANSIQQNLHVPPIVLTSFRSKEGTYNEQGIKKLTEIILPWSDNSFEFTFTALDYTDPLENQLAFKLEGLDENWHYVGTSHFGQYVNLSPGKYVLHLTGANSDGLWNKKGISITIIIKPPFWEAWWFKLTIVIAFIGIVLCIIQCIRKIQEKRVVVTRDHAIANTTSIVAHDVRKPFIGLKMMLQMLPKLTPEQTKKYSEDLDISIRKVDAMLKDIMEASREAKYELVPQNILTILDLAIKDVSRYHPNKYIDFYYNFDIVALIPLDEQRMCRAFENIIDNAFGFLPDKGGIIWFSAKEKNTKAEIIIGNTHSHIPEDKINKIFQDKFTLGKKSGTGLGLSIASKVVKGHNGSISAKNVQKAPGFVPENNRDIQGVEFTITLPLTTQPGYSLKDPLFEKSEEAKVAFGMVKKESPLAGSSEIDALIEKLETLKRKPNLLILDDESIYRMKVRDILDNLGEPNKLIHVYDASSYKEAIDILNHTQIDYLICDIDLLDRINDGFSVLSKTLEKYPGSMVLIHTNRKESEDISKAKVLGAWGFCPKPITESILVDLLLGKKLWPSDFKKKQPGKSQKRVKEYVKAVPNSTILVVNDDPLALKFTLTIIKSYIDPKDNIAIFTAKSYAEAKDIIDNKKFDILISDFNLDSPETGVDVCQYIKEKKSESVRIIYSGITGGEIEKLKKTGKDCIDDIFSTSYEIKDMLNTTFKILRKKTQ
jgi:ligand-binding sensor domain-containing protein/signal transduction histidine kinase/DNA-binding NarL/FixJ family response regulator